MMKCPACGFSNNDENLILLDSSRGKNNWKVCEACSSFFMKEEYDPLKEAEHSKVTSHGNRERGEFMNNFKAKLFQNVVDIIKDEKPFPGKLLDIGCSYGGFIFMAKENGFNPSGTDILNDAVEYVKSKNFNAYECYSLKDVNFSENFDVVTAIDCNYYWSDQAVEVKEINKILYPNGIFLVRTSDKTNYLKVGIFLRRFFKSFGNKLIRRSLNDHRFSMPISSLKNLMWSKGFELINISIIRAIHSNKTRLSVKLSFILGALIYRTTGIFLAPGAILVFKKVRESI